MLSKLDKLTTAELDLVPNRSFVGVSDLNHFPDRVVLHILYEIEFRERRWKLKAHLQIRAFDEFENVCLRCGLDY
jgi:hypothetical protein